MATLFNQGTLLYTPEGGEQRSIVSNTTGTEVTVDYGLEVEHAASPDTYAPGDSIVYSVIVRNTGSGTLFDLAVRAALADGALDYVEGSAVAFLSAPGGTTPYPVVATADGEGVIFTFSEPLPGGATVFLLYRAIASGQSTATARRRPCPHECESIVSTVTVTAHEGSPEGEVISESASTTIRCVPLTIVKSAPADAEVGETIAFRFTVTNQTDAPIVLDRLTDQLPAQFSFTALTLEVNGVNVPLLGTDYQIVGGLLTVDPAAIITLPAGGQAIYTVTGVVTA